MHQEPTDLIIDLDSVSKRFGSNQCLDGLTLDVRAGSVFGFLGPNGAGKTTTLRIMLGLVAPDGGQVSVLGLDPRTKAQEIRAQVGVLLEADGLYERLTAYDNLDYHARLRHLEPTERQARIEAVLRTFGLWERRLEPVVAWSKGMRQKLAIGRAMLHRPRLLLLDEPFSGLDPTAAVELRTTMTDLARQEKVTLVLTTHDLAHVEKACDDVAVIQGGRIIARGAPGQLTANSASIDVAISGEGLSREVLEALKLEHRLLSYALEGSRARVTCTLEARPELGVELVRRGVRLEELHTVRGSLEDVFLSLMSGGDSSRPREGDGV